MKKAKFSILEIWALSTALILTIALLWVMLWPIYPRSEYPTLTCPTCEVCKQEVVHYLVECRENYEGAFK